MIRNKQTIRTAALLSGIAAAALSLVLTRTNGYADNRQYLVTNGYYTMEQGSAEIEQWTEAFVRKDEGTAYRSRTELEYGVTDRLTTALYLVHGKPSDGPWKYAETKLETRYRLTEPGRRFWDTAAYLEMKDPSATGDPFKMEAKGIFAHEFPGFNLTANIIGKKKLAPGEKVELGYAVGITPYTKGRTRYALELYGGDGRHYVLPSVWFTSRSGHGFSIGAGFGLTDKSDRLQIRTMYAVAL